MVLARSSVKSQFDAKSNWLAYGQHHEGRGQNILPLLRYWPREWGRGRESLSRAGLGDLTASSRCGWESRMAEEGSPCFAPGAAVQMSAGAQYMMGTVYCMGGE
jgi:hypothetical protein